MVEHVTENHGVAGSIPALGTILTISVFEMLARALALTAVALVILAAKKLPPKEVPKEGRVGGRRGGGR